MKKEYLKDNPKTRTKLKLIGFPLVISGVVFMAIGIYDFFSYIGSFESPTLFWMIFVGMLLLFPGMVCLLNAYMGKIARYTSTQMSPVIKDTTNYLIDGTKDQILDVIDKAKGSQYLVCPFCRENNDEDSNYCDNCGKQLSTTCLKCNSENDADAEFCKSCGSKLK